MVWWEEVARAVRKIDGAAVLGLLGVEHSLAYKVDVTKRHIHNHEYWFGLAASPDGETHRADEMGQVQPFVLTGGASAWGDWVQIMGSSDTPVAPGSVKFDFHRIQVTTTNSTAQFTIQITFGESAGIAAQLVAKHYSIIPYIAATNQNDSGVAEGYDHRHLVGTKMWARCQSLGETGKTLGFYFGLHEYIG